MLDCMVTVEKKISEKEQMFLLSCSNRLAVNSAFLGPGQTHWIIGLCSDSPLSRKSDGCHVYKKLTLAACLLSYLKTRCECWR